MNKLVLKTFLKSIQADLRMIEHPCCQADMELAMIRARALTGALIEVLKKEEQPTILRIVPLSEEDEHA